MLVRAQSAAEVADMGVSIHHAGHNGFALHIHHIGTAWDVHISTNGFDAVVANHDGSVLNHLVAVHGDDMRIGKRHHAGGYISIELQADPDAVTVAKR